jgi:hypothetical protein
MLSNAKRTYALKEWTVEKRPKGWYFWRTYGDKTEAKGPYSSEVSCCLMIARQLCRELVTRDKAHELPS